MSDKDSKKSLLLRISPALFDELNRWADDEFRSVNSQIEWILTAAVRKQRKAEIDKDGELK